MPITIKHGSIFDSTAADVLVCPVNCVGVMGKGLALEFKRRWPEMYREYKNVCEGGWLLPGGVWWWQDVAVEETVIATAATKKHWRDPSERIWVEMCLMAIKDRFGDMRSIAIPQLGCGCGGLDWADVWPLYERHLGGLDADVEVWIHESH